MQFAKEFNSRKDDLYFNFIFLHHLRREADINSVFITLQHHHPSYFNQYLVWGLIHRHYFQHFNLNFRINDDDYKDKRNQSKITVNFFSFLLSLKFKLSFSILSSHFISLVELLQILCE